MQGPTHLMLSWYLAEGLGVERPRDRRIVAWAGFAPDFDVLAYVARRFHRPPTFLTDGRVIGHGGMRMHRA